MSVSNRLLQGVDKHRGPHLGITAIVFTILFNTGLYFVISFTEGAPHFPNPRDSAEVIATYFQGQSGSV